MRLLSMIGLITFSVALLTGCGGTKSVTSTSEGEVPVWFNQVPIDPNFLYTARTATSVDMQMALDKAANEGRADISRQLESKVNSLERRFREEVGTGEGSQYLEMFTAANKQVTSNVLVGSKVKEQKFHQQGNVWRAYVLMELPLGAAKQAMIEQIKANDQMYTRFRATQVFQELDHEVKKYDEWKKEQREAKEQ